MKHILLILIVVGLAFTFFAAQSHASGERAIQIHGFISQGYIQTTENNFIADSKKGTFEFNEMGMNFGKRLTSDLHIGLQLFAKDFGEVGNNEIKIDWVLADYRLTDWLGLRLGQLKAPHGLYNEYRDIDTLRTFIFLPQSIYPEITRDVTLSIQGGSIYGLIDLYAAGRISYQALYGTQRIDGDNNRLVEALSDIPISAVDNDTVEVEDKYVGSLAYDTPFPGLRVGISYDNVEMLLSGRYNQQLLIFPAGTPTSMKFKKSANWVYSLEYTWQDLVLMAEYIDTTREFKSIIDNVPRLESKIEQTGWYGGASYRFADWFEAGAYYSQLESEADLSTFVVPGYYDELTDICGTFRFDLNEYWILKLEYHTFTGAKGLSARDNPSITPDDFGIGDFEEDWTMFATKLTVAF